MDDFYVYLPANVKNFYFENTSANYKTKLSRELNLSDDYEIGLAEITYTYTMYNIYENEIIYLKYLNSDIEIEKVECILKKGYYKIGELVESINETLNLNIEYNFLPKLNLINEKYKQRINCTFGKHEKGIIFLEFSENLSKILGIIKKEFDLLTHDILESYILEARFRSLYHSKYDVRYFFPNMYKEQFEYEAEETYDLSGSFKTMFVYCDIIRPHLVGDSRTQLLKLVQVPNNTKFGDQVHLIFDNIIYFPIQNTKFESIEIDIKDDTGINIPFNYAKNVIVLHFRKINKRP